VWLEQQRKRISSLDLCGRGRFTLLTGLGGEAWLAAARTLAIESYTIGPAGCDAQDIYGDWYTACEIEEDGCILVRPDMHVAWRCRSIVADPRAGLTNVMSRVLGSLVA
jgi:2,4-dichlorophenol 6-monooxygenase